MFRIFPGFTRRTFSSIPLRRENGRMPLPLGTSFGTAEATCARSQKEKMIGSEYLNLESKRALFLTNSFNSMAQRAYVELSDHYSMDIRVELAINEKQMVETVNRHKPDMIICPFLTKRIPEEIWRNTDTPCLVVHPGIHGDRGASSIDWALKEGREEWGVTVLHADEEMDAGDIWATSNFQVPPGMTKSELYGSHVVDVAMECLHEAMAKIAIGKRGIPLNYSDPNVKGTLRPNMKLADRNIDFNDRAEDVARAIRVSDSSPGAPCEIAGHKLFVFNSSVDMDPNSPQAAPGTITGTLHGAVRIACGDGSVWITHIKGRGKQTELSRIKLPATQSLPDSILAAVSEVSKPCHFASPDEHPFSDLWVTVEDGIAVVNFPFLNGAMSTDQCKRLTEAFRQTCSRSDVQVVVLAGGRSAWSNGINLNTIEAADDPTDESWQNINAMNDFVRAVFSETDKVTVAALQGNAGAGGAMAALACDFVWAHGHTVLNPHYKSMGLHGSEYWTYFLPRRVGPAIAHELTKSCMPISANFAEDIGMIDNILSPGRNGFMDEVTKKSSALIRNQVIFTEIVSRKTTERDAEWFEHVESARDHELRIMRQNFINHDYIRARKSFVHKKSPNATPAHLVASHCTSTSFDEVSNPDERPSAIKICGSTVSKAYKEHLATRVEMIKEVSNGDIPILAVVIVSGNADSERYVLQKVRAAKRVGIQSETHRFCNSHDNEPLEEMLTERIQLLNEDSSINGVMVQLPLPEGVNKHRILASVCPTKDVDGFMALSLGRLAGGVSSDKHLNPHFVPCTAKGIMSLLDYYSIPVVGKKVCIIGRSCIVGMPTMLCLMNRGATVTSCDINTEKLISCLRDADIVIAAAGVPGLVKADWIKPGAVVVDVGFHVLTDSNDDGSITERIVGDVDPSAHQVASFITPVPGGVGPMTVATLLENTVDAFVAQKSTEIPSELLSVSASAA